MPGSVLGTMVRRVEDPELLVGASTYVDNDQSPGVLHAAFVRSPLAHAVVASIDTTEAAAAPGVVGVFTAADLGDGAVPPFAVVNPAVERHALATDKVRYVGDPVALVVAETRAQAVDAVELVEVDYDDLPAVVDMERALEPGAPLQFEELGSNVAASRKDDDQDDPWEGAAHVVRVRMENQRVATAPIEGHAILVRPGADEVTVHVATQQPHGARDQVAAFTGLDPDRVRVVAPHVGGAFGGKAGVTAEHLAVVAAARLLAQPVKWAETRSETMLSMHSRGQVQYAELGLDADARILGMRLRLVGDCGAYAGFGGSFVLGGTRLMSTGVYRVPRFVYAAIAALTNTAPMGAFRGAGRPEAAALVERLMDVAAAEVGLAPEELRRRNLIQPDDFPYRTATGARYDVGDYDLPLREALRIADVDGARAEQRRRREAGEVRQLGIGIATYVEITGFAGTEFGSVEVHDDGTATVMAGTSAHGQGHATSFAMLVSDRLGIPMDRIRFVQSDTAVVRSGGGTGGSRSLQLGGSAIDRAATKVADKARAVAAGLLEADPADVEVVDGTFAVRGTGVRVSWPAVAAEAHRDHGGLTDVDDFSTDEATFPFGAHVSIVEVDTETGHVRPLRHVAVDDCGRILNPLLVQGQQHGGVLQGVSQALWEHFEYDEEGTPLTSTFVDYAIPTAADAIAWEVSSTETPTPINPLGAKGIGESATIGSTPAVQNAVVDALGHLGVRHLDLPCTPQRVWRAVEQARAGTLPELWREPPAAFDRIPSDSAGSSVTEGADV
ncbi:xanthine dehydrogenase family protein molybdopterin-binding subunit [Nocardioides sp. YIM 152315]|uniref:xanthine dehydrogenase family protein molybdopterin-binding subunit n=1 Tax=Nocardioides sp. YIM 152315 TaxID=3031760 RepID=UPI0023DAD7B7|nr:xanthine dehydrogenase family protein molybdopterin-binding subunit [Nocardioides sp. YIM 152315]MDF1602361.1 xanthine dehydrogenase family protein molybdopterin-binding subunit [Nocardioides sp. YIM 152315]